MEKNISGPKAAEKVSRPKTIVENLTNQCHDQPIKSKYYKALCNKHK